MASGLKSLSQIWNKGTKLEGEEMITSASMTTANSSRRQLSRQFKSVSDATNPSEQQTQKRLLRSRGVLSSISNLNVGNVPKETRKLIQAGADKVNQTLNDVRNTFGTWSQVRNDLHQVLWESHQNCLFYLSRNLRIQLDVDKGW